MKNLHRILTALILAGGLAAVAGCAAETTTTPAAPKTEAPKTETPKVP